MTPPTQEQIKLPEDMIKEKFYSGEITQKEAIKQLKNLMLKIKSQINKQEKTNEK